MLNWHMKFGFVQSLKQCKFSLLVKSFSKQCNCIISILQSIQWHSNQINANFHARHGMNDGIGYWFKCDSDVWGNGEIHYDNSFQTVQSNCSSRLILCKICWYNYYLEFALCFHRAKERKTRASSLSVKTRTYILSDFYSNIFSKNDCKHKLFNAWRKFVNLLNLLRNKT